MRLKFLYTLAVLLAVQNGFAHADEIEKDSSTENTSQEIQVEAKHTDSTLSSSNKDNSVVAKKNTQKQASTSFESFTGKVTKNRVRMRLQPSLDGQIFKELEKDEPLLITGEVDDFYAVLPPKDIKGYIFRTYVLDGVVEGNNVNVRLEPDLQAPVLTQMNSGDPIDGKIADKNSKWFQITLPDSVRFYVSKEYITKAGDKNLFGQLQKKKYQLDNSLDEIEANMTQELRKPFADIILAPYATKLNQIIAQNPNMQAQVERAKDLLHHMQEAYLQKSLTNESVMLPQEKKEQQNITSSNQSSTKQQLKQSQAISANDSTTNAPSKAPLEITNWSEKEKFVVDDAIALGEANSEEDFYSKESNTNTQTLQGVVKPYDRAVKNRPGDYILIDSKTGLPIAYLYSTKVDLKQYIDKNISVLCSERPNNHFAFRAYFVYKVQ